MSNSYTLQVKTGSVRYGYAQDPSIATARGLMFHTGYYEQNRFDIGGIDLAILADPGYSIKSHDGLPPSEFAGTAGNLTGAGQSLHGDHHTGLSALGGKRIEAGPGDAQLSGGDGNDLLMGGAGVDSFDGGGNPTSDDPVTVYGDRISFADARAVQAVVADLRTGTISNDGFGNAETMVNIESLGAGTAFADTFHGNDGRNALLGSRGDFLYGHGGDDIIRVNAGPTTVDGGTGTDLLELSSEGGFYLPDSDGDGVAELAPPMSVRWHWWVYLGIYMIDGYDNYTNLTGVENVNGSEGGDLIVGTDFVNVLKGNGGDDALLGRDSADTLEGGDGRDELHGESGYDIVSGGNGNDLISSGSGYDSYDGGADDGLDPSGRFHGDRLDFRDPMVGRGVVANLSTGAVSNDGYGFTDTIANIESFSGDTAFADIFTGNDLANGLSGSRGDQLYGLGGDDIFEIRAATAIIEGGAGTDLLWLTTSGSLLPDSNSDGQAEYGWEMTAGYSVDLAAGTLRDGNGHTGTITGVENVIGTQYADELRGDGASNTLHGAGGNDLLDGRGAGFDQLTGGSENDVFIVDEGDSVYEYFGGGDDEVRTALASYALPDHVERLTGTSGTGQTLTGNGSHNVITGGSGNDILEGGPGFDQLVGGLGNDVYISDGADTIVEAAGAGIDELRTTAAYSQLDDNLENLTAIGSAARHFTGNFLDNVLTGGDGDDILRGGVGSDTVRGGAGNDRLEVWSTGADIAEGGSGSDLLAIFYYDATTDIIMTFPGDDPADGYSGSLATAGRSTAFSGIENFEISTGSGNDLVWGGVHSNLFLLREGNDVFRGRGGVDDVDGSAGTDGVGAFLGGASAAILWDISAATYLAPNGSRYRDFEYFAGLTTGSGADVITTSAASLADTLFLGAGNDMATVVNGLDAVDGQTGSDLLVIDYGAATAAVTTSGGVGGISPGTGGTGSKGRIGDGGSRRIDFDNIERFDVRTGSGNDNIVLGTGSAVTDDSVSLGGGDDMADFGRGLDSGDGGAGIDGLAADLRFATVAVSVNLVTNGFSGPAGVSFVNFEYFGGTGFQTGQGADTLVTGQLNRNDIVALGGGNDVVTVHDGHDQVVGGSLDGGSVNTGFDTLVVEYGAATASVYTTGAIQTDGAGSIGEFTDGSTRRVSFQAIDRFLIATGSGNDNIATGTGNDEIRTGGGTDTLSAGGGDDLLDGGAGADSMTGGAGNDLYFVDNAADSVNENAGEGTDEVRTGLAVYVLAANAETLTGTSASGQTLTGNASNNLVTAGGGNDVLHLWAGGGNDNVNAGAGMDNIFFGATLTAADVVNGGGGVDTLVVQGPYGSLTLTANITQIENLSILGGNNTSFGEPGTNRYDYVLTTHDSNFAAGVQARINGSALLEDEDFTFNGSAETNASFVVYGGKGRDTLLGGLGNDIFFYAEERFASGDTVNGGAGYDGMFLRGNYTIDFNAPGYTGLFTNIENLTLTSATDERYARGGGTEFDYNLILANAIVGAGQTLTVSGSLLQSNETMVLDGSGETDGILRLFGGAAADTLKGGALADLLHGAAGADTLRGGGGADVFRYQAVTESYSVARDHIADFTPGTDKIDLGAIDASRALAGDQAFSWIGSNAFSKTAGELRASQVDGQWIVQGDINGDGFADLVIALTLQGPTPLGAGDFLL